jgi:hypothetical protein
MGKLFLRGCLIVLFLLVGVLQAREREKSGNVNQDTLSQSTLTIEQLYPDPFTSKLVLSYSLDKSDQVTIEIHDLKRRLDTLFKGYKDPGNHKIEWNNNRIKSGVYYCHFRVGSNHAVHPIVIMK